MFTRHPLKSAAFGSELGRVLIILKAVMYVLFSVYSHPSIIPQLSYNYQKVTFAIIRLVSQWNGPMV